MRKFLAIAAAAALAVSFAKAGRRVLLVDTDLRKGTLYKKLGIPDEMFTPIFAIGRIAGWSAHRMEELYNNRKIIRPAFKSIMDERPYIQLDDR